MGSKLQRLINNSIKINSPDDTKYSIIIFKNNNKCNICCLNKNFYLVKSLNNISRKIKDGTYGIETNSNFFNIEFNPLGFYCQGHKFRIDAQDFWVYKLKYDYVDLKKDIPNLKEYRKLSETEKYKIILLCKSIYVNKKKMNDLHLMIDNFKIVDIIDMTEKINYFNKIKIQKNLININNLIMVLRALGDENDSEIDMYFNKKHFVIYRPIIDAYGVFML